MAFKEFLRHPIDTYRTAPFGTFIMGINSSTAAYNGFFAIRALHENEIISGSVSIGAAAICLAAAATGGHLANKQLVLKDRLEKIVDEHGYDERYFAPTTDEWCNRQTARQVARKHDVLPEYEALCDDNADTAQLHWMPNV